MLGCIVGAFLGLCLLYNVTLPIFEAPDEASHFRYAHYLADERRLPDLKRDLPSHEVTQPVLYYALVASVIAPFDRSNLDALLHLNPDWFDRSLNPGYTGVRGQHLHTDAERWPYRGAVWAVRAARVVSSLLGAATIVLVYLIARRVFGPRAPTALAANLCAALVAFNPKFIHLSSVVSNDIAITLAATAAVWWMVRMSDPGSPIRRDGAGFARSSIFDSEHFRFFVLGALIGLAVLCKLQGLGLFVPALIAVWWVRPYEIASRRLAPRNFVLRLIALLVGFLAVAGWWFAFNLLNYDHPLAWAQVQAANAALLRLPPLSVVEIAATLPLWFTSYWGNIGIELHYDAWVNVVLFALLALAVTGCGVAFARGLPLIENRPGFALLLVWQGTIAAMFAWWLRSYVGTENSRLIMPGVAATAVLVVMGWLTWLPSRWQPVVYAAPAGMLALAAAVPFVTILPAYATPDLMSRARAIEAYDLPRGEAYTTFDGAIELLHAEVSSRHVRAGEEIGVTLYWGARQPINQSYRVVLEALDLNNALIGRRLFIPFNGRFATQRWSPGLYFRDAYRLPVDADARRGPARIQLSLYKLYPQPGLAAIDGADVRAFLIDRVKVESDVPAAYDETTPPDGATFAGATFAGATFADMLRLDRVSFTREAITFDWTVLKQPDKDYTLFVHVLDAHGQQIGQQDAEPFSGAYPTSLWDAGERVRDVRPIARPPDAARLRIGWYDRQTGQRLTARSADGNPWPDDIVVLDIPQ